MGNCLVTKLKSSVDKDLRLFNASYVKFKKPASSDHLFFVCCVNYGTSVTAKITSGNGHFWNGSSQSTQYTFSGRQSGDYKDQDYCDIYFEDNNPVTVQFLNASENTFKGTRANQNDILEADLDVFNIYYTDFYWYQKIGTVKLNSLDNLKDIWKDLYITNAAAESLRGGSIDTFANFTNFRRFGLENKNIVGNIASLSKNINATLISSYKSSIEGSLESLASGMVANGRTSGTLTYYGGADNVTYNGQPLGPNFVSYSITFDPSLPNGYSIS